MNDLLKQLVGNDRRSIGEANKVVKVIGNNQNLFDQVFEGITSNNKIIAARSADVCEKVSKKYPNLLINHSKELFYSLKKSDLYEVIMCTSLMISYSELSKSKAAKAFQLIYNNLNTRENIFVKVNCITSLSNISIKHNSYIDEVKKIIDTNMRTGGAAIKARCRKELLKIEKYENQKNDITVAKTANYYTSGIISDKTKFVWIVLHGYGYLAENFINYFSSLDEESNYIIAPEALNKFYLKGFGGKVGASWMTSLNRESEIKDYTNFINDVYTNELKNFNREKVKINLLGFSQGSPTAIRWLINKNTDIDNLIIWGGDLPIDNKEKLLTEKLKNLNCYFVVGDKDQFINKIRIEEEIQKHKNLGLKFDLILFDGKHEIDSKTLLSLYNKL